MDRLDGELCLQRLDLDHLVLQIGVESFELRIHPLRFRPLRKRAVALGARVLELVLDAQQEVLRAGAMRQPLGLRGEQLARHRVRGSKSPASAWRSASRDQALHSPGR